MGRILVGVEAELSRRKRGEEGVKRRRKIGGLGAVLVDLTISSYPRVSHGPRTIFPAEWTKLGGTCCELTRQEMELGMK
jgi:hypothetical protein